MGSDRPSAEALQFVAGQLLLEAKVDRRMANDHAIAAGQAALADFHHAQWLLYEQQAAHREAVAAWLSHPEPHDG